MAETRRKKVQDGKAAKEEYEKGSRVYFTSIHNSPTLFIEAKKASTPYVYLDIRNLILLSIYEAYHMEKWVKLCVVLKTKDSQSFQNDENNSFLLKLKSTIAFEGDTEILTDSRLKENCKDKSANFFKESRKHPSITVEEKKMIICGISSVLRFIFKYICYKIEDAGSGSSDSEMETFHMLKKLLGFRSGCLQACAESSVWTKFCEVDMIDSVSEMADVVKVIMFAGKQNTVNLQVSENVLRFENHLSLPVKIHNFQRVIQDMKKSRESSTGPMNEITQNVEKIAIIDELKHEYAEGPMPLLSDLILFPSFHAFVQLLSKPIFQKLFPRTLQWHDRIHFQFFPNLCIKLPDVHLEHREKLFWSNPENVPIKSLYLRDTSRYKPSLRQFTRQYEVEEALKSLEAFSVAPLDLLEEDPNFKWKDIPVLAHPEGGSLPASRQRRKCDQLASMVFYALQVYSSKKYRYNSSDNRFRAVDFCSGGGHVGILLAWLLPDCDVVLVENKDESLRRAQERIAGLGLSNVFCYQSNLDYFESTFDLGLALHACGTASDLVISKCVKVNASFVCCPCCYGAMQENHILSYPRSKAFQKISLRHYLVLCHASDQTEADEKTTQGKKCMTIIDTDRCLFAAENRYDVKLCRIVPESASPKNHILVAISSA